MVTMTKKARSVWIVHRDVPFEFGHVVGVFSSEEKATAHMKDCLSGSDEDYENESPDDWSVSEWEVK